MARDISWGWRYEHGGPDRLSTPRFRVPGEHAEHYQARRAAVAEIAERAGVLLSDQDSGLRVEPWEPGETAARGDGFER